VSYGYGSQLGIRTWPPGSCPWPNPNNRPSLCTRSVWCHPGPLLLVPRPLGQCQNPTESISNMAETETPASELTKSGVQLIWVSTFPGTDPQPCGFSNVYNSTSSFPAEIQVLPLLAAFSHFLQVSCTIPLSYGISASLSALAR